MERIIPKALPRDRNDSPTPFTASFTAAPQRKVTLPEMFQEATRNAREVAEKFAKDSQSRLGKIKRASQGQFSINNRDSNTP